MQWLIHLLGSTNPSLVDFNKNAAPFFTSSESAKRI